MLIILFRFFKKKKEAAINPPAKTSLNMSRFYIVEIMLCTCHFPSTSGFIPLPWSPFPLDWAMEGTGKLKEWKGDLLTPSA